MTVTTGRCAVVLAAGNGTRLSGVSPLPKPLVPVGGRPLLDHVLGNLARGGVSRVAVVVGCEADRVRQGRFPSWTGEPVRWIENRDFERPNGVSLLAAAGWTEGAFALVMADHLFDRRTLDGLLRQPCPEHGGILAIDRKIATVFDADEATKAVTRDGRLERVGKCLARYDGIDTGMFLLHGAVFDAMRESARRGDESLSGGINELAARGAMRAWDIGAARWIDIDTPESWAEAERLVSEGVVGLAPDPMARCVEG